MRRALAVLTALLVLSFGMVVLAQSLPEEERGTTSGSDAQVVAGPIPEKITSSSAVVWWQTTAPQESILIYGTSPDDQPYRIQRPWSTVTHEVSVKRLQPGTTYYVAILQPDGSKSAVGQFTTQPQGYSRDNNVRITNGPLFEQISPDSVTVAWSSNVPSAFTVRYGTDPQKLEETAKAPWTPTTHRVVLGGLNSDTHYYFTIEPEQQPAQTVQPEQSLEEQAPPTTTPSPQIYAFRTLGRGQQAVNIGPKR
jgi:phosphodiesterase/alkaline phosphatase D-like protein